LSYWRTWLELETRRRAALIRSPRDLEASRRSALPVSYLMAVLLDERAYLMTLATTPAPTVRPPSRMAKRRPSSIAIGWIRLTTIFTLSPGITISTPSGNWQAPVTSVVRK